ncbi:protein trichome birefringence-like 26 [Raphanus sativus]|uniref:Protein trichome birefringence-like 26 n=1 Tax=Raphanus sativus TaxID=3726 RepID=A0A6J0KXV5_RAPSA|nr:protein trichome birefringence-like 26 [Raphanus sativus]
MEQQLTLVLLPNSPKGASANFDEQTLDDASSSSSSSCTQTPRTFLKFFLYFSLVALAYYFIISTFTVSPVFISLDSPPVSPSGNVSSPKCDLFSGDWIPDPSGPLYTNLSCHHIQDFQNCLLNGRPDVNYLFWRWKPRDCDLPRFSPSQFLDRVRNKWWAFVGDSIARNHVQSLICILSQVEEVVEVYHDKEFRSKIWRFPSHNFTLSVVWSPFLVKSETLVSSSSSDIQLYLDQLDHKWTHQYSNFDYVVISGGKWFLKATIFHENNTVTGCHYCQGRNNLTDFGYDYSYRKTLKLLRSFVRDSTHKPLVLFRTTTPDHFENGEWNTGGYCNRTMPFKEDEAKLKTVDDVMRDVELDVFRNFGEGSTNFRLLDTTGMSLLRPDGHPGPYRHPHPFAGVKDKSSVQNDCLHWCLPGPIDSWNDVMVETILNR